MKKYAFYPFLIVLLELQKYIPMSLIVLGFFFLQGFFFVCVCVWTMLWYFAFMRY